MNKTKKKRPEHSKLMKEYYRSGRMKPVKMFGSNNPSWRGDKVSYSGLHHWMKKELGKPNKCIFCFRKTKRYEWANINKKYTRNPSDWISLCVSCHKFFDMNLGKLKRLVKVHNDEIEEHKIKVKTITNIIKFYEND